MMRKNTANSSGINPRIVVAAASWQVIYGRNNSLGYTTVSTINDKR